MAGTCSSLIRHRTRCQAMSTLIALIFSSLFSLPRQVFTTCQTAPFAGTPTAAR